MLGWTLFVVDGAAGKPGLGVLVAVLMKAPAADDC